MNTFSKLILSVVFAAISFMSAAQTTIKSTFDALVNCPEAVVTESHLLEKDPSTGVKQAQCDIYNFELPASRMELVRNVISAVGKDSEKAFKVNQGKTFPPDNGEVAFAIGDGSENVTLAGQRCDYIYALFPAPSSEDKDGIYRYAYGMSYKEEKGKITGRLVISYATTLKYRQEQERNRQRSVFPQFVGQDVTVIPGIGGQNVTTTVVRGIRPWFETMMSYLTGMKGASPNTRLALATKAFKEIQEIDEYDEVSNADKSAVREMLKVMISEKEYYQDTMLVTLLNQCLAALK